MGAFHWQGGLFFNRKPDGSIEIYKLRDAKAGTSTRVDREDIATIPAASWASIVSSSSKDGESGETFLAAFKFHTGVDFDAPKPPVVVDPPKWTPPAAVEPPPAPAAPAAAPKKRAKPKAK